MAQGQTQLINQDMVALLSSEFQRRYEPNFSTRAMASESASLPGCRGAWTFAAHDSSGNAFDHSGNNRTLTWDGPLFGYEQLYPYAGFDGASFFYRNDEADLDILGNETFVVAANRGLTLGGWFYFVDALPALDEYLMAKWIPGGAVSYRLIRQQNGTIRFSVDNGATVNVTSTDICTNNTWYYLVGRYAPGFTTPSMSVFINKVEYPLIVGIPAAPLTNSNAMFAVGSSSTPSNYFKGKASDLWLCAEGISTSYVQYKFQQSRAKYNA